ncbi:PQQ-dependent sugar dehydrogenase [Modestobacter sp. VKM Ac-2979]|uniref:PQQ-dependent sugar dehydrogenase n=1 Tax=unclassified Modestobacter TaxID=2643866 RepID=UPI0022AB8A9A|nr:MULTISPECIES: PQQ-dependent sugar dehydrogenase [unclassified Modestobacter]MCZ2811520.1 PQQ-dependent sugar dehydrogenase [Modestobacter sp. VKM Ac-2979]MCZ2841034.1 PQQ-dependent sugar dehydrogenase [Modestobacter sp. VKM Ac-2980]
MTRRPWVALPPLLLLVACGATDSGAGDTGAAAPAPVSAPTGAPALDVEVVLDGLDHPWDVAQAPDGTLLVDERAGGLTAVLPDGEARTLDADFGDLFAEGETGLMGLALDPDFAENRRFYTCQGVQSGGAEDTQAPEIQVIAWTVDEGWTAATRVADPLLGGIPVNADSGRHGGCRVEFGPDGALFVGTGDNALGTNPQDLGSLAGKVLRIDPETGEALPDNPFTDDADAADRIWTYGHRNVQGLAVHPDSGQVYSVEHGPDRDDEVNLLQPGADFGWDPVGAGVYDESVPMTAPGAVPAVWSSGEPTIAPSGATFLDGAEWGDYDGLLLIGVQKDTGVLALRLTDDGELVESFRLPELEDAYGRIRTPEQGQDGALYVTTDNGGGEDQLLRVTPAG